MLGWCIVTLASASLKASVRFPPFRGMYQRGKGCDRKGAIGGSKQALKWSKKLDKHLAMAHVHREYYYAKQY